MSHSDTRFHSDRLHPAVYCAIVGLAVWVFFSGSGSYTSLALAVVTGFIVVAVGLPLILSRVGRGGARRHPVPYRDWAHGEFEVWDAHLGGRDAALQVLLPIAAAAVGMTLIGLAFYFATPPGG